MATDFGNAPTFRLTVRPVPSSSTSEIVAEFNGSSNSRASGNADLRISRYDQATLRWYFEEYLQYPVSPAPEIARQAEHRIGELGEAWFSRIFLENPQIRMVWTAAAALLESLRVEIDDATPEGAAIAWELLRPPGEEALPLRVRSFARTPSQPRDDLWSGKDVLPGRQIRILLVISRPAGIRDVPFRPVAQALLDESAAADGRLEVSVLRPATFDALQARLADATAADQPFDIVHFDGHGGFDESTPDHGPARPRQRGCVVFESASGDSQLVPGNVMGAALRAGKVRALVLNACRSAHADAGEDTRADALSAVLEAFPSFATEVLNAGVKSVLAMRYNVFVDTAVATVAAVYHGLGLGMSMTEATTDARRKLAADPMRTVIGPPRPLADWVVPILFETAGGFPARSAEKVPTPVAGTIEPADIDQTMPSGEFVGRDSTILMLDRAFDTQQIVALRGMIGSGKSSTAAEFARWYLRTEGVDAARWTTARAASTDITNWRSSPVGRALPRNLPTAETSSSRDRGIMHVIDDLDAFLVNAPEAAVAGYARAVEEMAKAGSKILLVSRRGVKAWLSSAVEIGLPPMTTAEQLTMIASALSRRGAKMADLESWRARIHEARGNPLFIEDLLWDGSADKPDPAGSVRRSLTEHFTAIEYESLGLLAFFRGRVDVESLSAITTRNEYLPRTQLTGMTVEQWSNLLRRLAEVGAAAPLDARSYALHPSLADVLSSSTASASDADVEEAFIMVMAAFGERNGVEFRQGDPRAVRWAYDEEGNLESAFDRIMRRHAWLNLTGVMSGLLTLYESANQYDGWDRLLDRLTPLVFNEDESGPASGMEYTWGFVSEYGMERHLRQGQYERALSRQEQRIAYDTKVVQALQADPPMLDGYPQYAQLLTRARPEHRAGALKILREDMRRGLAVSVSDLADLLRDLRNPACVDRYVEALRMFYDLGDYASVAKTSHGLSRAFFEVPQIRDLAAAQQMAEQSLSFRSESDIVGRAVSYGQLGNIFYERYRTQAMAQEGGSGQSDDPDLVRLVAQAAGYFERALAGFPEWDLTHRGNTHNQLGIVYMGMRMLDEGRRHYAEAIAAYESIGDLRLANSSRINLAAGLLMFQRFAEAKLYATEAADFFEQFPQAEESQMLEMLIRVIDDLEQRWPRA